MALLAAAAKARLVGASNVLQGLTGMENVKVYYDPQRNVPREAIYAGDVGGSLQMVAMRGASGRVKYLGDLSLTLQVRVHQKGTTTETTDARAEAIADLVIDYIAANPTLGGLTGLKKASVDSIQLSGWFEDESATSTVTLQIGLMPFLS